MKNKVLKVAITHNIIASYREGFYDRLFSREDLLVKVYCQDEVRGMNLNSIHHKYPNNVHIVKYISAKREKLAWQFIPWREILSGYDVVLMGGRAKTFKCESS